MMLVKSWGLFSSGVFYGSEFQSESLKECNTVSLALPLDEGRLGGGEPSRTMTSPSVPLSPAIKLSGQLQQCFLPRSLPLFIVWGAVWSGLARLADYHVRVRRYRHRRSGQRTSLSGQNG